jgi:hypothetical protein
MDSTALLLRNPGALPLSDFYDLADIPDQRGHLDRNLRFESTGGEQRERRFCLTSVEVLRDQE